MYVCVADEAHRDWLKVKIGRGRGGIVVKRIGKVLHVK